MIAIVRRIVLLRFSNKTEYHLVQLLDPFLLFVLLEKEGKNYYRIVDGRVLFQKKLTY